MFLPFLSSLLQSFLRICITWLSHKTRTLRPFWVILAKYHIVWSCNRYQIFETILGGACRQTVFYFAQHYLQWEMYFCYWLEFSQAYLELYLLVFSLLNFDNRYVRENLLLNSQLMAVDFLFLSTV